MTLDRERFEERLQESAAPRGAVGAGDVIANLGDLELIFGEIEPALKAAVEAILGRPMTSAELERVNQHLDAKGAEWRVQGATDLLSKALDAVGSFFQFSRDPDAPNPLDDFADSLLEEDFGNVQELAAVAQGLVEPGGSLDEQIESITGRLDFPRGRRSQRELIMSSRNMPPEVREQWIAGGRQISESGHMVIGEINDDGILWGWNPQTQAVEPFGRVDEADEIEFIGGFAGDTLFPANLGVIQRRQALARSDPDTLLPGANLAPLDPADRAHVARGTGDEFIEYGPPQYIVGDEWTHFATKDPSYITMIQNALVEGNWLRDTDVIDGVWTPDAARAMSNVMLAANVTGGSMSWTDILKASVEGAASAEARFGSPGRVVARPRLVLPTFKEPDYAQLQVEVRDRVRSRLGRDPLDYEMALLAEELNHNYRAEYDAQVAALKQEFHAGNRVLQGGIASGGTVQDVNPLARLMQTIEERYGAEIEMNEDRLEERQNVSNVFNVLTQTSRVLGGSAF